MPMIDILKELDEMFTADSEHYCHNCQRKVVCDIEMLQEEIKDNQNRLEILKKKKIEMENK